MKFIVGYPLCAMTRIEGAASASSALAIQTSLLSILSRVLQGEIHILPTFPFHPDPEVLMRYGNQLN